LFGRNLRRTEEEDKVILKGAEHQRCGDCQPGDSDKYKCNPFMTSLHYFYLQKLLRGIFVVQ
jgi:hypothetical protein